MNKQDSVFASSGYTFSMSLLAIVMLFNYAYLLNEAITPLRVFGMIAWIFMTVYFVRAFMARARATIE